MPDNLAKKLFNKKILDRKRIFVNRELLHVFIKDVMEILYPHFSQIRIRNISDLSLNIQRMELKLNEILKTIVNPKKAKSIANKFTQELAEISDNLDLDARAIFSGDPAADSIDEVIFSYPGFFATAAYRISHFFHQNKIPIVPRMISEYAHRLTGIDIHPGATIGKHFCIDHGTGIVIGATTIIGENVKIYQGVTLGAISVGSKESKKKRHPTIEDNCTIYSNATILGGNTTIGRNSIIGGNIWLTESVAANSIVYKDNDRANKFKAKI